MTKHVDFQKSPSSLMVTSDEEQRLSKTFWPSYVWLDEKGANIERLMTGAIINAEGGEVMEIVKKLVFQGKPWNDETKKHLIKELGDTLAICDSVSYHVESISRWSGCERVSRNRYLESMTRAR